MVAVKSPNQTKQEPNSQSFLDLDFENFHFQEKYPRKIFHFQDNFRWNFYFFHF